MIFYYIRKIRLRLYIICYTNSFMKYFNKYIYEKDITY